MSTKKVPARVKVTCDACGAICNRGLGKGSRKRKGIIIVEQASLDYSGEPVANGGYRYDLCDKCLELVCKDIDSSIKNIPYTYQKNRE